MIRLTIKDRSGEISTIEIPINAEYNVMEVLKTFGFSMRATCGGMGLCADCHCQVLNGATLLPPATEQELETMDILPDATHESRLCCQIQPRAYLDGVYLMLMGTDQ